ncbi:hypothetical protein [Sphingomonas radiodurans]|uniref:hypothetical protein n=1 Tax=Sphingomonas radiodurans TaxID=2890321 RepID=UPI001E46513A|nr:hypothetical protein [Sphingomonas radiodurans]WBH15026.1 hypothetical protein LLW23_09090 [Sphingomonas radiodurans]
MIINARAPRAIVRAGAQVALILAAWALIMLALPFVGAPGRQVAVLGDTGAAVRAIRAAGGSIVEARRGAVLARSPQAGFARRLYAAGAPAVIEGRIAAGCIAKAGA